MEERRREDRFVLPEIYQKYVKMEIKLEGDFLPALLQDFSRHGIKFRISTPFRPDSFIECRLSIPRSLEKELVFTAKIKHCIEVEGNFTAGAEIDNISDDLWFRVFEKVHDFIIERAGGLY